MTHTFRLYVAAGRESLSVTFICRWDEAWARAAHEADWFRRSGATDWAVTLRQTG